MSESTVMHCSTCIELIIEEINLIEEESHLAEDAIHGVDKQGMKIMKQELRLVRTFFLCARKWTNHGTLGTSLSCLEDSVRRNVEYYYYSVCLRSVDGMFSSDSANLISGFRQIISSSSQEIEQVFNSLLDFVDQQSSCSSPAVRSDEVVEILDSLLQNLEDLLSFSGQNPGIISQRLVKHLHEKLMFLRNFIRFAMLQGVDERQLEDLLIHSEVLAVNAARLSYVWWFDRYDGEAFPGTELKISELLQRINPVDPRAREIYIQVLLSGSRTQALQHVLKLEMDNHILRDFLDSLVGILRDLLNSSNSFLALSGDEILILYKVLTFLRTILRKQQQQFNNLNEDVKDLIGVVMNDVAIIILSLHMNKEEKLWVDKEMDLALLDVLDKIKLVKAKFEEKHPVTSMSSFPKTSELGFMDFLLKSLKVLSGKVDNSIPIVNERLKTIQEDLEFLRCSLECILEKGNLNEELQTLWSRVINVVYKAEFVIDSLKVGDIPDCFALFLSAIIEEVEAVQSLQAQILQVDDNKNESQIAAKISNQSPLQRSTPITSEAVVGFDDEAETIIGRLTRGTMQLDVVSIVGMPGIGKTTLAKKVYNDPSVKCYFHIFAWSCVSQAYEKKNLFLEILACIDPKYSNQCIEMTEDDLAETLYRCMKGNKYLIVLDDIWDVKAWNCLERSFVNDANGSRILLTSRISRVALQIRPKVKLHYLRRLNDDESWELLQKKLSVKECYTPEQCAIGRQIAKTCGGLPLTIVIIAGILATSDPNSWKETAKSSNADSVCSKEHCMHIVDLSYQQLPAYLKSCFLSFGAFLPGQRISVQKLTWLWIAEGFVKQSKVKSLEDVAEGYLMDLVDRSLVMIAKQRSTGGVKFCCIHDLLHEFCVAKAKEENFLQLLHKHDELFTLYEPHNLTRMRIYSMPRDFKKFSVLCPQVHSLLFFGNGGPCHQTLYDVLFLFRIFKALRVLDLTKINLGNSFPSPITSLRELRYLAVRFDRLKSIPSLIANLQKLETFMVWTFYHHLINLPHTIWKMNRLRHLHGPGFYLGFAAEDQENSSLSNLDTFATAHFYFSQLEMLRKCPYIRSLKCRCIRSKMSAGVLVMNFLSRLESLKLCLHGSEKVPLEFHSPRNLKKLSLDNFSMSPIISTIGKLPNLEVLKLVNVAFDGEAWDMEEELDFIKLRILKLKDLQIARWTGFGDFLPCLQKLVLWRCRKLDELPSCLGCIPALEMIEVRNCPNSVLSLVKEIEEEQISLGNEHLKILNYNFRKST